MQFHISVFFCPDKLVIVTIWILLLKFRVRELHTSVWGEKAAIFFVLHTCGAHKCKSLYIPPTQRDWKRRQLQIPGIQVPIPAWIELVSQSARIEYTVKHTAVSSCLIRNETFIFSEGEGRMGWDAGLEGVILYQHMYVRCACYTHTGSNIKRNLNEENDGCWIFHFPLKLESNVARGFCRILYTFVVMPL